jgi:starch synthase
MKIVQAASECLPFSKTGGLSDVVYSLSKEYVKLGHNVSIIIPYYQNVNYEKLPQLKEIYSFKVKMNWRNSDATVVHCFYEGMDFYLIQNANYFARDTFYGYPDDGERFAFFQNAVIELIKHFAFSVDVLHCHDWQAGMLPCLLKEKYRKDNKLNDIKTVLTIHNPLFKGFMGRDSLYDLFGLDPKLFDNGSVRLDGQVSTLKAGIKFADKISTVSPTHAYELTTVEGSKGLWYDMTLRQNDFVGILNGMDTDFFNPETDKMIKFNYNLKTYKEGKRKNKEYFCKEYNLDPDLPLFIIISRLTSQKGLDLMDAMADFLSYTGGNIAVLGSGEKPAEDYFNDLYKRNSKHVMVYIGYNEALAHQMYAASDFLIMPSAFEPCGLSQMICQAYGSLPIVRRTGGLRDSVIPYNDYDDIQKVDANGFAFVNYNVNDANSCVKTALDVYVNEQNVFASLIENAMKVDHSWKTSALKYLDLYNSIKKW